MREELKLRLVCTSIQFAYVFDPCSVDSVKHADLSRGQW